VARRKHQGQVDHVSRGPNTAAGGQSAGRSPRIAWALCGIVAVTAVAYANSFGGDFVFDDVGELLFNPALETLFPPWDAMFDSPRAPARPLPYLTFAIDTVLWGRSPVGYHATSLLIHIVAALALFDLARLTFLSPRLRSWCGEAAVPLATAIAMIWAVHPLQTQAITYIYQRIESLTGMLCLVSLACFARAAASGWSARWLAACVGATAAAMASKEHAVVLPFLVLLYDWLFSPPATPAAWWTDIRRRPGFYVALCATWLVLAAVLASQAGKYQEFGFGKRSPLAYALTQPGVIMHYLRLTLLPVGQCLDYSGWTEVTSPSLEHLPAYFAVAAIASCAAVGVVLRRPESWFPAAFLITLAPTSSVMPVEAFVNEHRMYLPLAAVVGGGVVAAYWFAGTYGPRLVPGLSAEGVRRAGRWALAAVVVPLVLLTLARNALYHSPARIWNDVLDHDPGNHRALWRFAEMMLQQGDEASAVQLADRAVDRRPSCDVFANLAATRLVGGDYRAAERLCRRGMERQRSKLPPDHFAVLCTTGDLATALRLQGKLDEANELCEPRLESMRRVLGRNHTLTLSAEQIVAEAMAARGDHAAAQSLGRDVLARARKAKGTADPITINATVSLGRVLDAAGRPEEAIGVVQETRRHVQRKAVRRPNDLFVLDDVQAEFLEHCGRFQEAVALRRRLADEAEQVNGIDHPLTASALNKHALATAALEDARGRHAEAAVIYRRLLPTYETALGAEHPETRSIAGRLAESERLAAGAE
jgi:tetratricopeptide (TPR) repeat protein